MKVSKNRWRGSKIEDLNELIQLAQDKQSIVIGMGNIHFVRPAAWVIQWPLQMILNRSVYHALDFDPQLKTSTNG
jgi:hypothetical protein